MDANKVCFVIAFKYFRGYESYLGHYIENIQRLYPEALTIVVDNNSTFVEDVFGPLRHLPNIVFLTNDRTCKFEVGAYTVGAKYIIDNNLINEYSYFIFTQENFVLKNHFNFASLIDKKTYALPINSMCKGNDGCFRELGNKVLAQIGLPTNLWSQADFVWCHSLAIAAHKVEEFYKYLSPIVITTRSESEASERYLGVILYVLNEYRDCGDIDGSCKTLTARHYDCWNQDMYAPVTSHWRKRVQQRSENTRDR